MKELQFYYDDLKYYITAIWNNMVTHLLNNNLLDKPIEKINKIAIITFENRKDAEYIDLHNKNVLEYCKKWNYDYLFYDKCIHNVYWCKLYYVLDALKTKKYDYVMWMDSDAIIKNPDISVSQIVNKYSSDIFVSKSTFATFCAGVFIIKNSPIGISYIEECINKQSLKCNKENDDKLKGFWAGMCYEQGIMNSLIINKFYKHTTCLPEYIIHNEKITETNKVCDVDTFILHLFISPNDLRNKCFKRYV
jgi:hypothetical protein